MLTQNSLKILEKRYLRKDADGNIVETPEEMFQRVAVTIAAAEDKEEDQTKYSKLFFKAMNDLDFLPNSPTLMNAGLDNGVLSACFVVGIGDSMEEIMDAAKVSAMIQRSGGGVGFAFSRLREVGSPISSTHGKACGITPVLNLMSSVSKMITQGGCIGVNSIITTNTGSKRLSDLLNCRAFSDGMIDPSIDIYDGRDLISSCKAADNGEAACVRIITEHGFVIDATPDHLFRTVNSNGQLDWISAGELGGGSYVCLVPTRPNGSVWNLKPLSSDPHYNAHPISTPSIMTNNLAKLIGYYVGNGCISGDRIIFSINGEDKDILDWVGSSLKELCPEADISITDPKVDNDSYLVVAHSISLCNWLYENGLTKPDSLNASIPEPILQGSVQHLCCFLNGLFTADGFVTKNPVLALSTASVNLATQAQQALLSIGIISSLGCVTDRDGAYGSNPIYTVNVVGKESWKIFEADVSFSSNRKYKTLESVISTIDEDHQWIIPNQGKLLRSLLDLPGRGCGKDKGARKEEWQDKAYRKAWHYLDGVKNSRELSRNKLIELMAEFPELKHPQFTELVNSNLFFERVKCVDHVSVLTADMEIPGSECFVANGFLVHNKRDGANMGCLLVSHPQLLEFINIKKTEGVYSNFNLSVLITAEFMEAVEKDLDWQFISPKTGKAVQFIHPTTSKEVESMKAVELFDLICQHAWENGEPGVIFIDEVNKFNPTPKLGAIEATNPCGEQPLLPGESCNLLSINLSRFVKDGKVDYTRLAKVVKLAVRFLDNVITVNKYPTKELEAAALKTRKIGLGVMGWADLLVLLGIGYGSDESLKLAEELMSSIQIAADNASIELAEERGCFPEWKGSIYESQAIKMRNATRTTIAPTGSISMIAGCSQGIEPYFGLGYIKTVMEGTDLAEVNPYFKEACKDIDQALVTKAIKLGSAQTIEGIPDAIKAVFKVAGDLTVDQHIRMQAAFQKYTDNACSKTVNMPNSASMDDVKQAYLLAYALGCKGTTVYRDGSRDTQVYNTLVAAPKVEKPKERPQVVPGGTVKLGTGCGNIYVTINEMEGSPFETFARLGKGGGCAAAGTEAVGRLVSMLLKEGVKIEKISKQLTGITCNCPVPFGPAGAIYSCPDAVGRALEIYKAEADGAGIARKRDVDHPGGACPDCGGPVVHASGCLSCPICGYSKCG